MGRWWGRAVGYSCEKRQGGFSPNVVAEKWVTNRRQDTADNEAVFLRHPPWLCEHIFGGNDGTLDTRRTSPSGYEPSDFSCAESSTTGGHSHDRQRPNIHWRVARGSFQFTNRYGDRRVPHRSKHCVGQRWKRTPVKAAAVRTQGFEDHNCQLRFVQRKRALVTDPRHRRTLLHQNTYQWACQCSTKASKRAQAAKKGKGGWRPERQRQRRGRQGRRSKGGDGKDDKKGKGKTKCNDNAEVTT